MAYIMRLPILTVDTNKRLLISRTFQRMLDRRAILQPIDHILLDAIRSSPHIIPQRLNNSNIYGYKRYLRGTRKCGEDSDDEGEDGDENDKRSGSGRCHWKIRSHLIQEQKYYLKFRCRYLICIFFGRFECPFPSDVGQINQSHGSNM